MGSGQTPIVGRLCSMFHNSVGVSQGATSPAESTNPHGTLTTLSPSQRLTPRASDSSKQTVTMYLALFSNPGQL